MLDRTLNLKGSQLRIVPQFDLTHKDLDIDYVFKRIQIEGNYRKLKASRELLRNSILTKEKEIDEKILEENKKYKDFVSDYKDNFSNLSRKYDHKYDPMPKTENEVVKRNIKKQEKDLFDNINSN